MGNPEGHFDRRPEQAAWLESALLNAPHAAASHLWEALRAAFRGDATPSPNTVLRWLKRYRAKHAREFLWATNPDKAKGKYQPAFGDRCARARRLNQIVEMDATRFDFMFRGDARRHVLCAAVEVFSGRAMLRLEERASGRAHGLMLRRMLLEWGHIEEIVTDNGKDYVSAYFLRALADFGIAHRPTAKFSGDQKPFVERIFRTLQHGPLSMLPGFAGHSVADAQAIRGRRTFAQRVGAMGEEGVVDVGLTRDEFQAVLDEWCLAEMHRPRKSGRLRGKTPAQVVDEWAAEHPIRRVADLDALDYALCPAIERTIGKKGIAYGYNHYIAPELGDMVGRRVEIRVSPETPGRVAVFYKGAFFCHAVCPGLEDVDHAEVAARALATQRAADRGVRAAQREARRITSPAAVARSILDDRLAAAPNASVFQVAEPVSTPALDAAALASVAEAVDAEARRAAQAPPAVRVLPLSEAQAGAIRDRMAAAERRAREEDPKDIYYRCLRADPGSLSPWHAEFMAYFETTPAGRGMRRAFLQEKTMRRAQ
jgi:transposase InsO family protein